MRRDPAHTGADLVAHAEPDLFYGGWVAILPAVVADHFGARRVSGIIGVLYTSVAIGTLVGPSAAGFRTRSSRVATRHFRGTKLACDPQSAIP